MEQYKKCTHTHTQNYKILILADFSFWFKDEKKKYIDGIMQIV